MSVANDYLSDTPGAIVPTAASIGTVEWAPARDVDDYRRHVKIVLDALDARRKPVQERWDYYEGRHRQLWSTERLRRIFDRHFDVRLEDNYCELAIDAVVLRLGWDGWQELDDAETGAVDRVATLVRENRLDLEQEELYRAAQVAGEHYLLVWPRWADPDADDLTQAVAEDGTPLYDITEKDARNCYVHTRGRERQWCAQVWKDDAEKRWRCTLYYGDEVVRLCTRPNSTGAEPPRADRFDVDPLDPGGPNDLSEAVGQPTLPLFRFARDKRGRSRLDSLRPIQDKINKLSVGKIVAAEFAALRQRYVLSGEAIPDDQLRAIPGSVWRLDPGGETEDGTSPPTKVGEFSAADLTQYDSAKREEVDAFLTIGMLPRNLRVAAGAAGRSGEAITKDNGPFVALIEDHQQMYGGSWCDLWEALGYRVEPTWLPAENTDSKAVAEEVNLYVDAGVPVMAALAWSGKTEDELAEVQRLLDEDANRQSTAAANALAGFDQGTDALTLLQRGTQVAPGGLTEQPSSS